MEEQVYSALEEQFVIRFPKELAELIKEDLEQHQIPKDLKITFKDERRAEITFQGHQLTGFLLDLPTLLESHRTVDTTQYVKVADICKILICVEEATAEEFEKKMETEGWQWMHGLTTPTWGLGRKRASGRDVEELERVEREVQRLLDADEAADSVSFALYQNDRLIRKSGLERSILEKSSLDEIASETQPTTATEDEDLLDNDALEADDLAAELELDLQQQKELETRKAQVESVANPLIRARLQDAIASLEAELKQKQKNNNK